MDAAHKGNRKFPGYTLAQLKAFLELKRIGADQYKQDIAAIEAEIKAREDGTSQVFVTPQIPSASAHLMAPEDLSLPATPVRNFDASFQAFLAAAQAKVDENNARFTHMNGSQEKLRYTIGPKRIKIVKGGAVYCFVDRATGDVLKAESYNKPHPTPRSNIFDADHGASGVNWHGGVYLR